MPSSGPASAEADELELVPSRRDSPSLKPLEVVYDPPKESTTLHIDLVDR